MNYENHTLKQHPSEQRPDEFMAAKQTEICLLSLGAGRMGAELE